MKKLAFIIATLFLTAIISYLPVRTIIKVKASCELCLCMNAPTCSDVVVIQRGMPLASSYALVDPVYVNEPYKSQYTKKIVPLNIALNGLLVAGILGMLLYVIKRRK